MKDESKQEQGVSGKKQNSQTKQKAKEENKRTICVCVCVCVPAEGVGRKVPYSVYLLKSL